MNESKALDKKIKELISKMNSFAGKNKNKLASLHPSQKLSAENLMHYLILRNEDIRSLQDNLHINGLSSLASSESHIMRQLQMILRRLGNVIPDKELSEHDYFSGKKLISERSRKMFGSKKTSGIPFLMITFDTDFADNYNLVKRLLISGMNIARINCAHDNQDVWEQMLNNVRKAVEETGFPCKVYMDLAGPKLRTSILGKGRKDKLISVKEGEEIFLAEKDSDFDPLLKVLGCDEEGIVKFLKAGERVLFDDGLFESVILNSEKGIATLKIQRISSKKSKLKSEKGINLPDSKLHLNSLTPYDLSILPFVCKNSDMIGYSFVRNAEDLKILQELIRSNESKANIILKIETNEAVNNLPSLLIQGMTEKYFGVMITRGDLAVEIGFERMSEIQEEILWICEAAHVPVIWATQVLETLNKSGIATRSEVTDAAHSIMAECVLLNKGDYILEVMKTLLDILKRSGAHHIKKRYTFRNMNIASRFIQNF